MRLSRLHVIAQLPIKIFLSSLYLGRVPIPVKLTNPKKDADSKEKPEDTDHFGGPTLARTRACRAQKRLQMFGLHPSPSAGAGADPQKSMIHGGSVRQKKGCSFSRT